MDEECLIWLGEVFHVVITLGTKDECIYWIWVKDLIKLAWRSVVLVIL